MLDAVTFLTTEAAWPVIVENILSSVWGASRVAGAANPKLRTPHHSNPRAHRAWLLPGLPRRTQSRSAAGLGRSPLSAGQPGTH